MSPTDGATDSYCARSVRFGPLSAYQGEGGIPTGCRRASEGTLDYYLTAQRNLVIIEAKNADLQRGFTQLAAELVALDRWLETPLPVLYGAVSIGNVWQFGLLERERKHVTQDLNLSRVPDLKELLSVLWRF